MHFNLFSGVLFTFAAIAVVATAAYPKNRRESLVAAAVFGTMGFVLLFV